MKPKYWFILVFIAALSFQASPSNAGIFTAIFKGVGELFSNVPLPKPDPNPFPKLDEATDPFRKPRFTQEGDVGIQEDSTIKPYNGNIKDEADRQQALYKKFFEEIYGDETEILDQNIRNEAKQKKIASNIVFQATLGLKYDAIRSIDEKVLYSISHVSFVPIGANQYRNMFGQTPTGKQLSALKNVRHKMATNGINIAGNDLESAGMDGYLSSVIGGGDKFITITGHNESGYLVSPYGERISISRISEICEEYNKKCFFLSCNSEEFVSNGSQGIDGAITFEDAVEAIEEMRNAEQTTSGNMVSFRDLSEILTFSFQKGIYTSRKRTRIRYFAKTGGAVTAVGLATITASEYNRDHQKQ